MSLKIYLETHKIYKIEFHVILSFNYQMQKSIDSDATIR